MVITNMAIAAGRQPNPPFSQERAPTSMAQVPHTASSATFNPFPLSPTSVAFAELQFVFLDSLVRGYG
jgi:hypothetical protein